MHDLTLFAENALDVIKEAPMLPEEAVEQLQKYAVTIQEAFETKQVFRTETEARCAVLNDQKFPTVEMKYWQSVREEDAHFGELVKLSFQYRRTQLEIKKIERMMAQVEDDLDKEMLKIDLEEKLFGVKQMQLIAKHRVREVVQWEQIRAELKDNSPNMNVTDPNEHQLLGFGLRMTNEYLATMRCPDPVSASEMISVEGVFVTVINRVGVDKYRELILPNYNEEDKILIEPFLKESE